MININGVIHRRDNHYLVEHDGRDYASCVTYEQAYFYQQEFNKRGWDKNNLEGISDDYPLWYNWLNRFYIYITRDTVDNRYNWKVTVTPKNSPEGKLEYLGYVNLEDALFERDFLAEHNWDYELLVECIDDNLNPYYNMILPPFPERKIRGFILSNYDNEIKLMGEYIHEHGDVTQYEMADYMNASKVSICKWLKRYNIGWTGFKKLCLTGADPLDCLKMEEHIYSPDLTPSKESNFKNYVVFDSGNKKSYKIVKDGEWYGAYATRELADKISNGLQELGWSKENLDILREQYDCLPRRQGERDLHFHLASNGHYSIRKNHDGRNRNYGTYSTWLEAAIVRSLLISHEWDKDSLGMVQAKAKQIELRVRVYQSSMFYGVEYL